MKTDSILNTITSFEATLERYRSELKKNPLSIFYSGLVKNTEAYIEELKAELKKKAKDKTVNYPQYRFTNYFQNFLIK